MTVLKEPVLVSVIIPAYNAELFLPRTLKSVLAQTYTHFEVIIVDDGSQDQTATIVQAFAQNDHRIRLLSQANAGVAAARNTGIQAAQGNWVAPIDADDLWHPENLAVQVSHILQSPESVGVVYSWSVDIDEQDRLTGTVRAATIEGYVYPTLICHNFIGNASATLIRRSCFETITGYDTTFQAQQAQGCEDWDLYLRLARQYEFRVVPQFLIGYRKPASSMSSDFYRMARSHTLMLVTHRPHHPEIPAILYHLSASSFYIYLAHQSHAQHRSQETLQWLQAAIQVDPITPWFRYGLYKLAIQSWFVLAQSNPPVAKERLLDSRLEFTHLDQLNPNSLSVKFKVWLGSRLHQLMVLTIRRHGYA